MNYELFPHPKIDSFKISHRPYYIASGEYVPQSIGICAPFHLCHLLNELGFEAYVTAGNTPDHLRAPTLTPDIIKKHKKQKRPPIAVYNGGMWGNLFECPVVVRWTMSMSGIYEKMILAEHEFQFFWNGLYDERDSVNTHRLCLPMNDRNTFNTDGVDDSKRTGFAYYGHKYLRDARPLPQIPDIIKKNGVSLCQDIRRNKEELAKIYRSVKTLYSYEDSAVNSEASLCGCTTVHLITDYTKIIYKTKDVLEYFDYAIPENEFDPEAEFRYLGKTAETYSNECEKYLPQQLNDFVRITQSAPLSSPIVNVASEYSFLRMEKIYLYGCGLIGNAMFEFLRSIPLQIEGFIVSDEKAGEYQTGFYLGVPVLSLSKFRKIYHNESRLKVVVCLMDVNANQVIPLLKNYGIQYEMFDKFIPLKQCISNNISYQLYRVCHEHSRIFIYGIGISSNMVLNGLRVMGINVEGFITSDGYDKDYKETHRGLPVYRFSEYLKLHNRDCGVVLAMISSYSREVISNLIANNIDYAAPEL